MYTLNILQLKIYYQHSHRQKIMQPQQQPQTIPVLFKREIDQNQPYKHTDFQFQVPLTQVEWRIKDNKNPQFVIFKTLHVRPNQLVVSFEKKPKNRLIAILGNKSENDFIFINFDMFNTQRHYAKSILGQQIILNKEKYNFFGYSKSNLKQFSCYFYKGTKDKIQQIFSSFGDFDQIYEISKKAARLSLLYSESNFVCQLQNQQIKTINDIERDNICFSDGCGYISRPLARKIKHHIKQTERQLDYLPAVYQIRIKGIKGIVLINPQYENTQQIIAGKSMVKFKAKQDKLKELVLINYSKPSHFAAINQQIIMLLWGLGIKPEYFIQIQQNYLNLLREALINPLKHIELLKFLGKQQIIEVILKNQTPMASKLVKIKSIISEQIYRNIKSKELKNKLRIPLQNARCLYGAVYPQLPGNKQKKIPLKENQIFLRVTKKQGVVTIIGKVIVAKNPCYYCGDIRILEAVDISNQFQFSKSLVDVIIFSTQGKIPVATTISGSDYDGDQYFVCWDQYLIPKHEEKPFNYPMTVAKKKSNKVTQDDLINYFVNFDRTIVGKINNRYLSFATISPEGVRCDQCVQLGTELFSKAIDSVNTGERVLLPDHLKYPNLQDSLKEHVWIKMTQVYEKFFQNQFKFNDQLIASWDVDQQMMVGIIQTYISNDNYNDYQLFRIIKSWYKSGKSKNYDLFKYVNFSKLDKEQKRDVDELPNFPKSYFGNPFQNSPIFSDELFRNKGIYFHTHEQTSKKWRPYYKTEGHKVDFQIVEQALQKFHNVLLGIQVNGNVKLVFSITRMKKTPYTENNIPDRSLKVYYAGANQLRAFPNAYNRQKQNGYNLFFSDELLQIYQKDRRNSFFWFKKNKVSIDLTRFDYRMLDRHQKINKKTIRYLQVFVGLSENFKQKQQPKKLYVSIPRKEIEINNQNKQTLKDSNNKPKYKQKEQTKIQKKIKYVKKPN